MKKLLHYIISVSVLVLTVSGSLIAQSTVRGFVKSGPEGTLVEAAMTIGGDLVGLSTGGNFTISVSSGTHTLAAGYNGNTISKILTLVPGDNWMNFWFDPPTLPSDFDGNYYNTVEMGTQIWMGENLKVTHLNDGTSIPNVIDNAIWHGMDDPTYSWYDNNFGTYKDIYGAIYNGYSVSTGKLCPTGWHVPTRDDWFVLQDYIGGWEVGGGKLKSTGTIEGGDGLWHSPNTGATNEYGFSILPGGFRSSVDGSFWHVGNYTYIWINAETEGDPTNLHRFNANFDASGTGWAYEPKVAGCYVRCLNDLYKAALTTIAVSNIRLNSVETGGEITSDGGSQITERGVCWGLRTNPTISDNHMPAGTGIGSFTSSISSLLPGTTYYVRAYATNTMGTAYGNEISFSTYKADAIQDVDGNFYNVVTIGSQVWLTENLKTTKYSDGSVILNITDNATWEGLTSPAYAWYDNNILNKTFYGALYNWYVLDAATNGGKNVCPLGWHVPTDGEIKKLEVFLGMTQDQADADGWRGTNQGSMLKSSTGWYTNNGTNISGFTFLPGGYRFVTGVFGGYLHKGSFWSIDGGLRELQETLSSIMRYPPPPNQTIMKQGHSIRCTKDNIIVTNTDDNSIGSLRYALEYTNSNSTVKYTVTFNIPEEGALTIRPNSPLPPITNPVIIDGYTQPGASVSKLLIELDGTNAGEGANGLIVNTDNCTLKGLVINRFSGSGIYLDHANGSIIEGNFIGTDITGKIGRGNGSYVDYVGKGAGISIYVSNNNRIGGSSTIQRNLISGNPNAGILISGDVINNTVYTSSGNLIQGNLIGTDLEGNIALENHYGIKIEKSINNTIGGLVSGERNTVSGNYIGIDISGSDTSKSNRIIGNYIGTDITGSKAVPRGTTETGQVITQGGGIALYASETIIGGSTPEARNIISGNGGQGLSIMGGLYHRGPSSNNIIKGNYVGVDATGNLSIPNGFGIMIMNSGGNQIGGNLFTEGNLISGNNEVGLYVGYMEGTNNIIEGNLIGTTADGKTSLGNGIGKEDTFGYGGININGPNNTIGGDDPQKRNIISGNLTGLSLRDSADNCIVLGNYIGTDITGTKAIPNINNGIAIKGGKNNMIGGSVLNSRNIISANSKNGIFLTLSDVFPTLENPPEYSTGNIIQGNFIGTDITGIEPLGNSFSGVNLGESADNNVIGGTEIVNGNIIAYNGITGIICASAANPGKGNLILSNSIYSNSGIGIDLGGNGMTTNDLGDGDTGANNLQNYPILGSVSFSPGFVNISGSLNSIPSTTGSTANFKLQFFASKVADGSDYGEGQTYLGDQIISTDLNGDATFKTTLPIKGIYGQVITATATDLSTNCTSEFSMYAGGLPDQVVGMNWPIRFVYNSTGAEKITDGTDITAITASFDTWSNISTAKSKFVVGQPTDMANAVAGDGINLVSFMDTEYDWPEGVLAYASKTTKMDADGINGKIIDADIIVNPAFKDVLIGTTGVTGETGTPGFYDIQSIITHEIGHVLGLLHSGLTRSTMFFWMHKASVGKRTLESDDIAWASYKYPQSTYSSTYGTISGNIKYGYGLDPVAGALVTAINKDNEISFHSYSDADGNYVIPVLSGSNQYYIHIQPLDGDVGGYPMTPANISSYIYSNTGYTDYPNEYFNTGDTDGSLGNGSFTDDEIKKDPLSVSGVGNIITNKDLIPPEVVSVTPDNGSVVKVLPDIIITFSEAVDLTSFNDINIYLQQGTVDKYYGSVTKWEGNTDAVIFTPEKNLPNSALLTLHLNGITDLKGNILPSEYNDYSIITIDPDIVPPRVTSSVPGSGDEGVFVTDNIIVSFSEPLDKTTLENNYTFKFTSGGDDVDCSLIWSENGSTVTFDPEDPLIEGTGYTLKLLNDITDLNDVKLFIPVGPDDPPDKNYVEVSFITVLDGNPTTTYIGPGANALNVPVNTPVVIDFSEPIEASIFDPDSPDYSSGSFMLQVKGGASIPGSYEVLKADSRVVFRPESDLSFATTYEIMLTTEITDKQGNSLELQSKFPSEFTTSSEPLGPSITYIEKPTGVAGDEVVITGIGFDPLPANNLVSFGGTTATVEWATLTSLNVAVPVGTVSGEVSVSVDGSTSEGFSFYIIKPSDVLPDDWGTSSTGIGNGTHRTDLNGDCTTAFVTNSGSNTVSVVDIDDKGKLTWRYDIPVGEIPMDIALNSTDTRAYVTNYGSHTVSVIDLTTVKDPGLYPDFDPDTDIKVTEINVGINPYGVAVVPDGDFVYVANYTSQNLSGIDVNPNSGGFDHAVSNTGLGSGGKGNDISGDAGLVLVATDDGLKIVNINPQSKDFDCFNCVVENAALGTSMTTVDVTGDAAYAIVTTEDGRLLIIDVLPGSDYFGTAVSSTGSSSPITSARNAGDGLHIYATTENHDLLIFEIIPGGVAVPEVEGSYTGIMNLKLVGKLDGIGNDAAVVDALNQRLITADSELQTSGSSDGTLYITGLYVPPEEPIDRIARLILNVQELMYGSLKRAKGNELISFLNRAILNIEVEKNKDAITKLNTFIVKLKDLVKSRSLTPDENDKAQDMINTAYEIIAQLKGTKSGDEEITITGVETQLNQDVTTQTRLGEIYPNPAKESITINYEIASDDLNSGKVTIQVYDIIGRLVGNLVNTTQDPGRYSVTWNGYYENGSPAPRGIYYVRFTAGNVREVRQIMLVR